MQILDSRAAVSVQSGLITIAEAYEGFCEKGGRALLRKSEYLLKTESWNYTQWGNDRVVVFVVLIFISILEETYV